jgi:hypothetical protein
MDNNKIKEELIGHYKFMLLWMAFNSFYKERYKDQGCYRDNEYLAKFKSDYKENFLEYIRSDHQPLVDFKKYVQEEKQGHPGIKNMKKSNDPNKEYHDINNFDEYVECIYQVRNNLFHGEKDLLQENEKTLVEKSFYSLYELLKFFNIIT